MKRSKILSVLLAAMIVLSSFSCLSVVSFAATVDSSVETDELGVITKTYWLFDDDGTLTIYNDTLPTWESHAAEIKKVVIEAEVTKIAAGSFENHVNLESFEVVVSQGSLTAIEDNAFKGCTKLKEINIPASVKYLGSNVFKGCSALETATIGGVTSCGDSVFKGCGNLTNVVFGDACAVVGKSMFENCVKLSNLQLSDGIKSIGDFAFYNCNALDEIRIPDGVTSVGNYAFSYCNSATYVYVGRSVESFGSHVFKDCGALKEVYIADAVSKIWDGMFEHCDKIETVRIPDSIESIGSFAFEGCKALKAISVPSSVKTIGSYAFYDCSSAESLYIGHGLSNVGEYAFGNCTSIKDVKILCAMPIIAEGMFYGCSSLKSLENLPDGIKYIEKNAFANCTSFEKIDLPSSVISIGDNAFEATALTTITIPSNITSIGSGVFTECDKLVDIFVDDNNRNYADIDGALYDISYSTLICCPAAKTSDFVVHNGTSTIEIGAFIGCEKLASVTIPSTVTHIAYGAFNGCADNLVIKTSCNSYAADFAKNSNLKTELTHSSEAEWVVTNAAGCESSGERELRCADCDHVLKVEGIDAIGHNYDDGQITKKATCEEDGIVTFTCQNSGCTKTYTKTIPALGHKYTSEVTKEPTCDADGEKRYTCQNENCYSVYTEAIPATDHKLGEGTVTLEATCETDGVKTYECTQADCNYKTTETIPATGHKMDKGSVTKEPTCTELGVLTYKCLNAGCAHETTSDIPALGHTYDGGVITESPTVNKNGVITYTCEICKDTYTVSIPNTAFAGILDANKDAYADENGNIQNLKWFITDTYDLYVFADDTTEEWVGYKPFIVTATFAGDTTTVENGSLAKAPELTTVNVLLSLGTIEAYAFQQCPKLETVVTGSIKKIENFAFHDCEALEYVEIYGGLAEGEVGDNIFYRCDNLSTVILGNGCLEIGYAMFMDCAALTEITLPESLVVIGDSAFDGTSLKTINIPKDVEVIEKGVFTNCNTLTSIDVDDKNDFYFSVGGALYDIRLNTLMLCPAGKAGEVVVWDGATEISDDAFIGCKKVTKVNIPNSVMKIGANAFNNCATNLVIKGDCDSQGIVFAKARGIAVEIIHVGAEKWIVATEPTCTVDGSEALVCPSCDYVYETKAIPATGHKYDDGVITKDATCEDDGVKTFTCTNGDCIDSYTEVIPATDHKYDDGVVTKDATCEEDGVKTFTCINGDCTDSYTEVIPATGHKYDDGVITKYPTINENGEKTYTCQNEGCQYTYTEAIPNIAFDDILAINDGAYADENNKIQNITWYLTKAGVLYVYADGTEAEWEDYKSSVKSAVIAKTVKTIGQNAFMNCTTLESVALAEGVEAFEKNAFKGCAALAEITLPETLKKIGDSAFDGTSLKTIYIPADVEVIEKGVFTNCTALTAINVDNKNDNYFSVDGVLYNMSLSTLALCPAGKSGEVVVWDGTTTIAEDAFIGCKRVTKITIPNSVTTIADNAFNNCATALTIKGNCDSYAIAFAKGRGIKTEITHVSSSVWQITKEATCLEAGSKELVCSGCDYVYETQAIKALGHDYNDGVVTTKATCEANGVMTFSCTRTDCSESYTEVIPALKHNYDTGKVIQAATCTDDGTMRYSCQNDGCLSYYDEVIEKTGHNMDDGTITVVATCEVNGEKVYKCQNAGCLHKVTEVIEKSGHKYDDGVVSTPATCTEKGVMTFTCQNEGCVASFTEAIEAIGHEYVAVEVKKATCLEDGKIQHTCANCADFYTEVTKGAHVPYSAPVKVEPTCTQAGKEGAMCAVCRQFIGNVKEIPATGHTYVNGTCSGCGDKTNDSQKPSTKPGSTVVTPESSGSSNNSTAKVPATPKLLLLKNRNEGLVLTWKAVDGATGYRVYRRAAGAKSWTYLGTVKECTYLDKAASTGQYWRYTVRAVNDAGFSGFENGIYIKRVATPHVGSIANTPNGVKVTWSAISNAKTYKVYRRGAGETWKCIATVTGTSFVDTAVKSGSYYRYTVRAVDGYYSAYESGLLIKFVAAPHLTGVSNTSNGVRVNWNAVDGADSYRVYRRAAGKSWTYVTTVTGTSYVDTAVKGASGYYRYTVRAVDGAYSGYEAGLVIKK